VGKQEREDGTNAAVVDVSDEDLGLEALSSDTAGQGEIVKGERGSPGAGDGCLVVSEWDHSNVKTWG
jgi:hypothetical protein